MIIHTFNHQLARGRENAGGPGPVLIEPLALRPRRLALTLSIGEENWEWFERAARAPIPEYAAALSVMLFCLEIFAVVDAAIPFIYFQF